MANGISRRRRVVMAGVLVLLATIAGTAGARAGLVISGHGWIFRGAIANRDLARLYLTSPAFRRFIRTIEREDDHTDVFATMWDGGSGVLLSRHLFRSVVMNGQPRYMYRPGVSKLAFRTGGAGVSRSMETVDTPEIREALRPLDTPLVVTAAYDERGFRRSAWAGEPCDVRVMFLGDSFTDGMWVGDDDTFVSRYAERARRDAGPRVCAINTGVNGYGTAEEAWVLEQYFDAVGRPPVVFVMHHPNDVAQDEDAVLRGTADDAAWRANVAQLDRIRRFTADRGATMVLASLRAWPRRDMPFVDAHVYQDRLQAYASRCGIAFVDVARLPPGEPADGLSWAWDPHFTPAGHRVAADTLYAATRGILERAAESSSRRLR